MPSRPDGLVQDVLGLLAEAEMQAFAFKRATGIDCPSGCGDCCRDHHPEDSVLAALPAARWALERGWEEQLVIAAREASDGPCVFYDGERGGHCAVYPLRPLICRLFGYAAGRDKHGQIAYRPCRRMVGTAHAGPLPPVYVDLAQRLEQRHPPLGNRHLPLNQAFLEAAAWLSLRLPRPRAPRGRAA
ncbi:MAG: YkgJ family cysteine cluster protein [Pseudomonadota bacterium]